MSQTFLLACHRGAPTCPQAAACLGIPPTSHLGCLRTRRLLKSANNHDHSRAIGCEESMLSTRVIVMGAV